MSQSANAPSPPSADAFLRLLDDIEDEIWRNTEYYADTPAGEESPHLTSGYCVALFQRWRREVVPLHHELVATLGARTEAGLRIERRYAEFLESVACAMTLANQFATAYRLVHEAVSRTEPKSPQRERILKTFHEIREGAGDANLPLDIQIAMWAADGKREEAEIRLAGINTGGSALSEVVGMSELKAALIRDIVEPLRNPERYQRYHLSLPNGIMFFGPPGCGKTYVARKLAQELGYYFQEIHPSDVASPFIHDTVSKIQSAFADALKNAPAILFIDEFEAFVPARSELSGYQQYKAEEVNEFLANLDGCAERNVLVIAATNEPDKIDPAIRRSGRFDKLIFIPPPDCEARKALLDFYLAGRPLSLPIHTNRIAVMLDGYSASDIRLLVDESARLALAMRESISTSTILEALEHVPPSVTKEQQARYSQFQARGV